MFNKLLFNRNAYDRSIDLPSLSSTILSSGSIKLKLVAVSPVTIRPITANGSMTCGLVMRQNLDIQMSGISMVDIDGFLLHLRMQLNRMSGNGHLDPDFSVKTPLRAALIGDGSTSMDHRFRMIQYMEGHMKSSGKIAPGLVVKTAMNIDLDGLSNVDGDLILSLPLLISQSGFGNINLRRLSELNENILELSNINLLPGETVTIDTGLLQVLFGMTEDVSSVTSDSVFFELSPGENEIAISTDSGSKVDVVAIWQNRWL